MGCSYLAACQFFDHCYGKFVFYSTVQYFTRNLSVKNNARTKTTKFSNKFSYENPFDYSDLHNKRVSRLTVFSEINKGVSPNKWVYEGLFVICVVDENHV